MSDTKKPVDTIFRIVLVQFSLRRLFSLDISLFFRRAVTPSQNMQSQSAAKTSDLRCHQANTNEESDSAFYKITLVHVNLFILGATADNESLSTSVEMGQMAPLSLLLAETTAVPQRRRWLQK